MSTHDETTQSTIQAQKDEMMANFFEAAAGAQGPVHGCMLHVQSSDTIHPSLSEDHIVQSPCTWQGKPSTWHIIHDLNLDQTVDIVCLLKNCQLFQSFSDADHICRNASLVFKIGDLVLTESCIHGWIIDQKSKLQQQLDILYKQNNLPVQRQHYFREALQNAGEILSHWMFDQASSESDSEFDDILDDHSTTFYSQDQQLQAFLFSNSDNIGSIDEQYDATESIEQISTVVVPETILLNDTLRSVDIVISQEEIGLDNTVHQQSFDFLQETTGYAATIQPPCFPSLQDTIGLSNTLLQHDDIVSKSISGNDTVLLLQQSFLKNTMCTDTINSQMVSCISQQSTVHFCSNNLNLIWYTKNC